MSSQPLAGRLEPGAASEPRALAAARRARRPVRLEPRLLLGAGLLVGVGLLALLADRLAPFEPSRTVGLALQPPSARHWFGTDDLGRDVLSNVLHGGRVSLLVGLLAALTSGLLGTLIGSLAGFAGGLADDLLMRLTELFQVVPRFFLVLIVSALFGPSVLFVTLLLGLTFWPITARLLRAQVLSLRQRDFVVAARTLGASELRVLARHVLPNALSVVVVATALQVGSAILVEAGLSFLGLGDRSMVSWGNLLNAAQPFMRVAWWTSLFPGAAITLTVLAANLLGDGLQVYLGGGRRAV